MTGSRISIALATTAALPIALAEAQTGSHSNDHAPVGPPAPPACHAAAFGRRRSGGSAD